MLSRGDNFHFEYFKRQVSSEVGKPESQFHKLTFNKPYVLDVFIMQDKRITPQFTSFIISLCNAESFSYIHHINLNITY